jgi:hypothetical protein
MHRLEDGALVTPDDFLDPLLHDLELGLILALRLYRLVAQIVNLVRPMDGHHLLKDLVRRRLLVRKLLKD